jgi:hypothetical protein
LIKIILLKENIMELSNNPLQQYFRRPAIYIKLPSGGKFYAPSVITMPESGELPVYPMTAIDEITVKTPDALFNGSAVADIIKSCIPDIKEPWSINTIDLDAILIAIKTASNGNSMEINSICPECTEVSDYSINLISLLTQIKPGDYDSELSIDDLLIKFRPLTYKEINAASIEQVDIQRKFSTLDQESDETIRIKKTVEALKEVTEITIKILTQVIEYIKTPNAFVDNKTFIEDFLNNCDKNLYLKIRDHNAELRAYSEIKPIKLKCIKCQNEYEQTLTLNQSDFFG